MKFKQIKLGRGRQDVYVYFYPRDYKARIEHGFETWPCKVGYTTQWASHRVGQQVETSSPEWPLIGLVIHTDDGYLLEQALHAVLRLYHREIDEATGMEWFMTSPEEVAGICKMLRQV